MDKQKSKNIVKTLKEVYFKRIVGFDCESDGKNLLQQFNTSQELNNASLKRNVKIHPSSFEEFQFKPKSHEELDQIIALSMLLLGKNCNLNFINIENVINLESLFSMDSTIRFDGLAKENLLWLIENFSSSLFEDYQDKSEFYLSSISYGLLIHDFFKIIENTTDENLFNVEIKLGCFNGFINEWNTKNVVKMARMFYFSHFNQHSLNFDLSSLQDATQMFYDARFSKNFTGLNSQKLYSVIEMFKSRNWKGHINIDLSNAQLLNSLFHPSISPKIINKVIFPNIQGLNINDRNYKNPDVRFAKFFPFEKLKHVKNPSLFSLIKNLESYDLLHIFNLLNHSFKRCKTSVLEEIVSHDMFNDEVKKDVFFDVQFKIDEILKKGNFDSDKEHLNKCLNVLVLSTKYASAKDVITAKEKYKNLLVEHNYLINQMDVDKKSTHRKVRI